MPKILWLLASIFAAALASGGTHAASQADVPADAEIERDQPRSAQRVSSDAGAKGTSGRQCEKRRIERPGDAAAGGVEMPAGHRVVERTACREIRALGPACLEA